MTTITPSHGDRRLNKDDAYDWYLRTRDERRQERSYQQLELSHLSYVIQWRYDKAREIAGQIESLYVDGATSRWPTTSVQEPDIGSTATVCQSSGVRRTRRG